MSKTVTIAGTGSIGTAFALLFAGAGFSVKMWDALPEALPRGRADLHRRLETLAANGLLLSEPEAIAAKVSWHEKLTDALADTDLVQECIPEKLDLKREFLNNAIPLCPPHTLFASSTSAIQPSALAKDMPAADRILVAHPGNPPYLLKVIELVPSSTTAVISIEKAAQLYRAAGLHPVTLNKETEGFLFNRLQGAVLREAYCLVRDGISSVADIDAVMRLGLGRRWSVIGPFETVDLNTRGGIASHAEKMGPAYERMGAERGQHDPWTPDLVEKVAAERRAALPLDQWDERVMWRDGELMRLAKLFDANGDAETNSRA